MTDIRDILRGCNWASLTDGSPETSKSVASPGALTPGVRCG